MTPRFTFSFVASSIFLLAATAFATPHIVEIPLHDGRIPLSDLSAQLQSNLNLPVTFSLPFHVQDINLNGAKGSLLLTAINESLPTSAHIDLSDDSLVLTFDPANLPRSKNSIKQSLRTFVADLNPRATAAQARSFGLQMPANPDPARRLVVLVHGLDSANRNWYPIATLLQDAGYQVALFNYPSDQPITDSSQLFSDHMHALKESFPNLPVSIVAHSMGSLVARAYVEGSAYAGGVDHLILLAPPNHGSPFARYRMLCELQEHLNLAKTDPDWRPSWIVTDGLGEAGADLSPHSKFLANLNALPRREGVKYTIVAGNQSVAYPTAARALDRTARTLIPARFRDTPVLRDAFRAAEKQADRLAHHTGKSDGPVPVKSTHLDGVTDYVLLPTNHMTLQTGDRTTPPAAWDTILDRLSH